MRRIGAIPDLFEKRMPERTPVCILAERSFDLTAAAKKLLRTAFFARFRFTREGFFVKIIYGNVLPFPIRDGRDEAFGIRH